MRNCAPLARLFRSNDDHLLAKYSAYSSLRNSRATLFSRLSGDVSARNACASSTVGMRPAMSSVTRRRYVESDASSDGGIPTVFNFAKMNLSTKFFSSGTGTPSGIDARNTVALS